MLLCHGSDRMEPEVIIGTPFVGVAASAACDQPPVPGEQCRWGHREHLADLTAKHRVLMPQRQKLGILGHLARGRRQRAAEQPAHD